MILSEEIGKRVEKAITEKVFPGCVIGIVCANGHSTSLRASEREVLSFGHLTYEVGAPEVAEDTIYDVASITKSIPTASLALTLINEGKLRLSDKLISYVPEFKSRWREEVTVEHLLRYEIHGLQLATLKDKNPEQILQSAYSYELADKPGTESQYTNLPALFLGLVVERIKGEPLDVLAHRYFFEPLSMGHTSFFPISGFTKSPHVAPTEIDEEGNEICGIVHDESARVFARARRAVGHAGLFSTAPDLLNFAEALLQGTLNAVAEGAEKGLGWALDEPWRKNRYGPKAFSKAGFTGTLIVVDRACGTAFVILSNRTYPKRPSDASARDLFFASVADIVLR